MNEFIANPNLTETKPPPNRHNFLFKVFCVVLFVLGTEFCLYILIRKESEACKSEMMDIYQNLDNRVLSRPRRDEKSSTTTVQPGEPEIPGLPRVHGLPALAGPMGPQGARGQVRLQDGCQLYRANKDYYSNYFQMIWKETPKKEFSLDFLVIGPAEARMLLANKIDEFNFPSYELVLSTNYSILYLRPDIQKIEVSTVTSVTYETPKSQIVRSYSIRVWDGDHIEIKLDEEIILKWEGPHKFDLKYLSFGATSNMLFVYGCKGNTLRFIG